MTFRAFANLPGEMARRIREMDWSATPLGGSEAWPESLTLSIAMILASGFPMAIRWGPELVLVYNDAYRPILRDKHPEALGRSLREVWWEIYPELGPLNEAIPRGQRGAFFAEDHPWAVRRQGAIVEDARFTISYSPIPDEASPNGIGGVLTTCIETHLPGLGQLLLRAPQFRVRLAALGDLAGDLRKPVEVPLLVTDGVDRNAGEEQGAILADALSFGRIGSR